MRDDSAPLAALLVDVLSETATVEQREQLEHWAHERPEHRLMVEQARRALQTRRPDRGPVDVEAIVRAVTRQIEVASPVENRRGNVPMIGFGRPPRPLSRYLFAAALLVVVIFGLLQRGVMTHGSAPSAATAQESYVTANGQRATVTLTDGTVVMLDVGSRLQVPMDYGAGNHAVRLSGEAFFVVSHHDRHPFTVQAGSAVAQVLGTSFVVRHYPTDTATLVAVRDGKVGVGSTIIPAAHFVSVLPNRVGPLLPTNDAQFSFTTGVLMLPTMRLSQAIPELNRWYDADIRLNNPALGDQTIEGGMVAGSLADLAEKLRVMFNVTVVRDGRTLTLY